MLTKQEKTEKIAECFQVPGLQLRKKKTVNSILSTAFNIRSLTRNIQASLMDFGNKSYGTKMF